MLVTLGALAASAAGGWAWRRWAPLSFWYVIEFPIKAALVYLTWSHVASGCGLSRKRRRWRLTLDAVPLAGSMSRTAKDAAAVMIERRRVRSVQVEKAPRLRLLRPTPLGWRVWIRLH